MVQYWIHILSVDRFSRIITILLFICIGLSVIIKPFNGIVLLFIFLCNYQNFQKKNFDINILIGLVVFGIITSFFYLLNYIKYGFFFNPPQWRSTDILGFYSSNWENYFENIIYYLGFINLYLMPFTFRFLFNLKLNIKDLVFLSLVIFLFQLYYF